jgi:hypothetical protein
MILMGQACAAESNKHGAAQAEIINGQVNLGNVWSTLNTSIHDVHGDVDAHAAAVGNSVQIVTFADSIVTNDQSNDAAIGSNLHAKVGGVGGDVQLSATSVCNDADISTDPHLTSVKSWQYCGQADPSANVSANVSYAGGVGITANAVGNQIQVDSNATRFPVNTTQINAGSVTSSINANVSHVGSASVSASAVGNTAQIIHY